MSSRILGKICIFIFTQSHGQSQVERAFNNENKLQENLQEKSLIGCRLIYDEVKASGKQPHNFEISNGLVLNCKAAHARCTVDLAKNKDNQAQSIPKPACETRKFINERILYAKRQKMSLESCIEKMEEDADKFFVDAEKDVNPELLKTGNKLRKMIKENSEKKKKLEDDIARLELDLKKIS